MRNLLKTQINDPEVIFNKLPFTSKPRSNRMRIPLNEYKGLASIYMPPEAKTRDLTDFFYPSFETRESKAYKANLVREVSHKFNLA